MLTLADPVPYPKMDGSQPCLRDPEAWFPTRADGNALGMAAARLCRVRCKFTDECAAFALAHDVTGVWGGTSEYGRREFRRKHRIAPRGLAVDVVDGDGRRRRVDPDSTECGKGHPRTPENARRTPRGVWECRPCRRDARARRAVQGKVAPLDTDLARELVSA